MGVESALPRSLGCNKATTVGWPATLFFPESYSKSKRGGQPAQQPAPPKIARGGEGDRKKDARLLRRSATVCPAGIGGAATIARKESPRRTDGRTDGGLGGLGGLGLAKNRAHTAEGDKKSSSSGDTANIK